MASGNNGDPARAPGRRGSDGRRLSQELNSGKSLLGSPQKEPFSIHSLLSFFPLLYFFVKMEVFFHTSKAGVTNQLHKAMLDRSGRARVGCRREMLGAEAARWQQRGWEGSGRTGCRQLRAGCAGRGAGAEDREG